MKQFAISMYRSARQHYVCLYGRTLCYIRIFRTDRAVCLSIHLHTKTFITTVEMQDDTISFQTQTKRCIRQYLDVPDAFLFTCHHSNVTTSFEWWLNNSRPTDTHITLSIFFIFRNFLFNTFMQSYINNSILYIYKKSWLNINSENSPVHPATNYPNYNTIYNTTYKDESKIKTTSSVSVCIWHSVATGWTQLSNTWWAIFHDLCFRGITIEQLSW